MSSGRITASTLAIFICVTSLPVRDFKRGAQTESMMEKVPLMSNCVDKNSAITLRFRYTSAKAAQKAVSAALAKERKS